MHQRSAPKPTKSNTLRKRDTFNHNVRTFSLGHFSKDGSKTQLCRKTDLSKALKVSICVQQSKETINRGLVPLLGITIN